MKIIDYSFNDTLVRYLQNEKGQMSLLLLPENKKELAKRPWETENSYDPAARYNKQWELGSMVQLHLQEHPRSVSNGNTMKYSKSTELLHLMKQEFTEENGKKSVITHLACDDYEVIHTISQEKLQTGLMFETEFINTSKKPQTLEMLSSFSLDNISIFLENDAPDSYYFHRFRSGWSLEGKHICESIEQLNLEKSWAGAFYETEKFGCIGTWNVGRYFPTAVIEDRKTGVFWAAQLVHNASWQMELTRNKDTLSLSGGLADADFGAWEKIVMPGEHFKAPAAYVSVTTDDIFTACQSVTKMQEKACEEYGENGLPACFNEFCATWGNPTQDKMLKYAELLKDKGIKYIVIDAGWSIGCSGQHGNGTWIPNKEIFPDMKRMCEKIRNMGMIPGIWMEFEVTTEGSPAYAPEYDELKLKRHNVVIKQAGWRSFWDFRIPEVQEILTERVINFLKEYGFGYLKVDYNGSIGLGCDGDESLGEGLRHHAEQVGEFFKKIKKEIPDIVIENCASGGHRSEPKMIGLSAVTSFSDAHEGREIPRIAANLHNLMLPRQSLIWATLRKSDSIQRIVYQMASVFLGRICLSGDIDQLSGEQWSVISKALNFYKKAESVIIDGVTKIYGNFGDNIRYPAGTQIVVRTGKEYILVVCHAFENAEKPVPIFLGTDVEICDNFYADKAIMQNGTLILPEMKDFSAMALLLKKNK